MKQYKMIFVVDDDKTARYGVRRALEERYKILEADSAASARRVLAAESPDLLLLDIEMPEESGLDFLREIKAEASSPHEVSIFFTAAVANVASLFDQVAIPCGNSKPQAGVGPFMVTEYKSGQYVLLRRNPHPSEEEIREALGSNICRCTGYVKIIEAVKHAAALAADGLTP